MTDQLYRTLPECPTCHAPTGHQCKTRSGHGRLTHSTRYRLAGIEPTMPKGQHPCPDCGQVFVYENAMLRHIHATHHRRCHWCTMAIGHDPGCPQGFAPALSLLAEREPS